MKLLSLVVWVCWAAIGGRVLLAPAFRLTLPDALVLLLICAPAVGLLSCMRWVFRAQKTTGEGEVLPPAPTPPQTAPQADAAPRPRPTSPVKPVRVQVF
jgi:hypothetical protein